MSSPIYDLKPQDDGSQYAKDFALASPIDAAMTTAEIYKEVAPLITYRPDRFKDTRTYSIPVVVTPLNHHLLPQAELVFFIGSNQEPAAALKLYFQIKGAVRSPAPGTPVDWLFAKTRGESFVLASNGQTVSSNFRIGADIMPGPLSVFVSTPVSTSRITFWVAINITDELYKWIENSSSVEFRVSGMEYRLSGASETPIAEYAQALKAFAQQTYYQATPLAMRRRKINQTSRKWRFWVATIIFTVITLTMGLSIFVGTRQSNDQEQSASPSPNSINSPTPSPKAPKRRR